MTMQSNMLAMRWTLRDPSSDPYLHIQVPTISTNKQPSDGNRTYGNAFDVPITGLVLVADKTLTIAEAVAVLQIQARQDTVSLATSKTYNTGWLKVQHLMGVVDVPFMDIFTDPVIANHEEGWITNSETDRQLKQDVLFCQREYNRQVEAKAASAASAVAQAEVDRAQAEVDRAQAEVDRAQAEVDRAQATLQLAQAELQLAQVNLSIAKAAMEVTNVLQMTQPLTDADAADDACCDDDDISDEPSEDEDEEETKKIDFSADPEVSDPDTDN